MNPKEKQAPRSWQNLQAPQGENHLKSTQHPNTHTAAKMLNDPIEIKRRRDQRIQRNFDNNHGMQRH